MICSKNPKIYISIQVVTLNSNPNPSNNTIRCPGFHSYKGH